MAYVREQVIKRGDKVYRYYQLVRGYREDGKVKIEVLKHLGKFNNKAEAQAAVVTNNGERPGGAPAGTCEWEDGCTRAVVAELSDDKYPELTVRACDIHREEVERLLRHFKEQPTVAERLAPLADLF